METRKKKILALIPARAGSKGIPRKNLVPVGKHPLMAYSIGVALMSKYINRVVVTTDSEEFAGIARKYGAETPFLRPKKYATDMAGDMEYHKHAMDWLEKHEGYVPDYVIHLRPTTPVRDYRVVDRAIEIALQNPHASAVRSAHLTERTVYKTFRIKNGYADFFGTEDFGVNYKESMNISRQFVPKTYEINGYVDVVRPSILEQTGFLHGRKIIPFIIPQTADIDSLKDFKFAVRLFKGKSFASLMKFLDTVRHSRNPKK